MTNLTILRGFAGVAPEEGIRVAVMKWRGEPPDPHPTSGCSAKFSILPVSDHREVCCIVCFIVICEPREVALPPLQIGEHTKDGHQEACYHCL